MHDHTLRRMRESVISRQYVMTLHAEEEMVDDHLTISDVESGILTGEILERQKDARTGEWKFIIQGRTLAEDALVVAAKLSITAKLVIITVYRD